MKKDYKLIKEQDEIQDRINNLDKEFIFILYFKYKLTFKNLWKSPLLIVMAIFHLFNRKAGIDHVAHISRFIYDEETGNFQAKLFEATTDQGMQETDLFEKLRRFDGKCWIEYTATKVNKEKAKLFEQKYLGVVYSKLAAALAGIDGVMDDVNIKTRGGFCSFLTAAFLKDQGASPFVRMAQSELLEIDPDDIFAMNIGLKRRLK